MIPHRETEVMEISTYLAEPEILGAGNTKNKTLTVIGQGFSFFKLRALPDIRLHLISHPIQPDYLLLF